MSHTYLDIVGKLNFLRENKKAYARNDVLENITSLLISVINIHRVVRGAVLLFQRTLRLKGKSMKMSDISL